MGADGAANVIATGVRGIDHVVNLSTGGSHVRRVEGVAVLLDLRGTGGCGILRVHRRSGDLRH
jgi:hypothetical protein